MLRWVSSVVGLSVNGNGTGVVEDGVLYFSKILVLIS